MRRTLSAALLILAFCGPVSAGVIHNPPPEPSPLLETADVGTPGAYMAEAGWSESLTEATFDLLAVCRPCFKSHANPAADKLPSGG